MRNYLIPAASLLLVACSSNVTKLEKVTPQLVSMGHAETVTLQMSNLPDNVSVSLLPGGPYISSTTNIKPGAKKLALTDQSRWLLYHDGQLLRINGNDKVNVSEKAKDIATSDNLIAVLEQQRVSILTEDGKTVETHALGKTSHNTVRFNEQVICLVNEDSTLRAIERRNGKIFERRIKHVIHDLAALENHCAVLNSDKGISLYTQHSDQLEKVQHYDSGEYAYEFARQGNQLIVANSHQGVTTLESKGSRLQWSSSYNRLQDIKHVDAAGNFIISADLNNAISLISLEHTGTARLISDYALNTPVVDIALQKLTAHILSDKELISVDFSSMSPPPLSSLGVNQGGSRRAYIEDDIIYVADWFSGLHLYDISIANNPRLISSLHTPGSPKGVVVRDNIAYIADDDYGLQIADVRNKRRPEIIAELPLSGLAYTMKLHGNRLYLASHRGGLHIVDVGQPAKPVLLGTYDTPGKTWAVHVINDHYAFLADDDSGVLVLDVRIPAKMKLVSQFSPGGHAEDIVIRDNLAYVAFFENGLFILDVSNPRAIRQLSHLNTPGNARGIQLQANKLYLASWKAGFHIIDITKPRSPEILGRYDSKGSMWGLEVRNNIVYGLDWWGGLKTYDVSRDTSPRLLGQYQTAGRIERITGNRNYLYLASGSRGVQIFDSTNPLNPVWATGVSLDGYTTDVSVQGKTVYAAVKDKGVAIINVANPFHAYLQGIIPHADGAETLAANTQHLVSVGPAHVARVYNIGQTTEPELLCQIPAASTQVASNSRALYVINQKMELLELNANTLTDINCGRVIHVFSPDETYLTGDDGQLFTVNTTTNTINHYETGETVRLLSTTSIHKPLSSDISATLYNGQLFLALPRQGVQVFNLSSRGMQTSTFYPTTHDIRKPLITQTAIFLAGEKIIVSGERLPEISYQQNGQTLKLRVPAGLPNGAYHLAIQGGNTNSTYHNVFEVGFKKPKKKKFTMEDLKRKMQQGNFEGKAP